ncbi:hypothetical protein [Streptomyces caelestis]|uniref:hypothetical protein n=1 Tax=Streptomyces caelestis TaxID=36816 RepID=UPI00364E001F
MTYPDDLFPVLPADQAEPFAATTAFEDARTLLHELADGGSLLEQALFTVLLARRPAGTR